ncbi:hypothetical protein ACFE04_016161 [Oxalis oulophora]
MASMARCEFFRADVDDDGEDHKLTLVYLSLNEAIDLTTASQQLCSYFSSLMVLVHPDFDGVFHTVLMELGIEPYDVKIPSQAKDNLIKLPVGDENKLDWLQVYVIFGCCILMLFKNNMNDMKFHISSMKETLGVDAGVSVEFPFEFGQVEIIRTMLGGSLALKNAVINFLTNKKLIGQPMRKICDYLCNVLAWSGMDIFTSVLDTLVLPESPVTQDNRLNHEMKNFLTALIAVKGCKQPEFFALFALPSQLAIIQRNKFPILAAVAQRVNHNSNEDTQNSNLVNSLVEVHNAVMARNRVGGLTIAHSYLSNLKSAGRV